MEAEYDAKQLKDIAKSRMMGKGKSRHACPYKCLEGDSEHYKAMFALFYRGEERLGFSDMTLCGFKHPRMKSKRKRLW